VLSGEEDGLLQEIPDDHGRILRLGLVEQLRVQVQRADKVLYMAALVVVGVHAGVARSLEFELGVEILDRLFDEELGPLQVVFLAQELGLFQGALDWVERELAHLADLRLADLVAFVADAVVDRLVVDEGEVVADGMGELGLAVE